MPRLNIPQDQDEDQNGNMILRYLKSKRLRLQEPLTYILQHYKENQ